MTVRGRHRYGVAKNGWRQRHWLAFLQFDGQPARAALVFLLLRLKCRSVSLPWNPSSFSGKNFESPAKFGANLRRQRRVTLLLASTTHHETAGSIGRKIAIAVGLALSQAAVAAPPDSPDPALAPWFESLKQPGTGAPCCSIADCRTVEFRQDRDGYEVLIDGRWKVSIPFWLRVPPNRIIDRIDNPTNRGVVCFTPEAGILCFVRPSES